MQKRKQDAVGFQLSLFQQSMSLIALYGIHFHQHHVPLHFNQISFLSHFILFYSPLYLDKQVKNIYITNYQGSVFAPKLYSLRNRHYQLCV